MPYYAGSTNVRGLHLVFPTGFWLAYSRQAVDRTEQWLKERSIDPYKNYAFTTAFHNPR